ncbi:MAG: hypothetical protein JNM18_09805 [Planctomycetaceae bacterium]|nr:hypothetical protein [Planctomycetaceae bacterium]
MREAVLSREEVLALQADLLAHTQIQGVLCKAWPREQTPAGNTPLDEAVQRLLDRATAAVQIRYAYDSHEWTDTLLNTPVGVRLVRCQHHPVS